MSIAAINSMTPAMPIARTPEAKEGPGPDRDGDGDEKSVSTANGSPASAPQGMGAAVNTRA